MRRFSLSVVMFLFLLSLSAALLEAQDGDQGGEQGGTAAATAILPPLPPWDGQTRALLADPDDPWITPFEAGDRTTTPTYAETVAWLERLVAAAPEVLHLESFGKSHEGRDFWLLIASADGAFTPEALERSGKPVILVQAGIHSGEIDGKDAGMMLLRDMTVGKKGMGEPGHGGEKRDLLDGVQLLFVPIFNVDGHERRSVHSRVNQRGPSPTGWRTNARNLNFNRDYVKADTPGMQAMLRLIERFSPDLYVDIHVTDGLDYQYDVTWGATGPHGYSPAIATWLEEVLNPALTADLEAAGHVPGPLVFSLEPTLEAGLVEWTGSPRFSNGYGDARHLPTILVENHSLKPFEQRVLGTYVWLESLLRHVGEEGDGLSRAIAADRARRPAEVPLTWKVPETPPEKAEFLAIGYRKEASEISGAEKVVWTGEPLTTEVGWIAMSEPDVVVERPRAYWVPPAWSDVIARLALHGVEMERQSTARTLDVEMYRLEDVELEDWPYEGRMRVSARPVVEKRRETFPAGSVRVPMDQPLGTLAALLLEPASPDSFFAWGFFLEVLQRTEYVEAYVMEPMAERMLEEDPELRRAFERKIAEDEEFAADPRARLQWFYARTPFFDERWWLYPVARER